MIILRRGLRENLNNFPLELCQQHYKPHKCIPQIIFYF